MDEIRQWWGHVLKSFFSAVGRLWERLASGVMEDWNVTIFIIAMGVIVILAGISMWRRRA